MKIRFFTAVLLAALGLQLLTGCSTAAITRPAPITQPIFTDPLPPTPLPTTESATETAPAPSRPASVYSNLITKEQATAIALADAGFTADQVTRLRTEFDYDDGRPEYEVDFHQGGYEYDYEIHAETGVIISKDKDRED